MSNHAHPAHRRRWRGCHVAARNWWRADAWVERQRARKRRRDTRPGARCAWKAVGR